MLLKGTALMVSVFMTLMSLISCETHNNVDNNEVTDVTVVENENTLEEQNEDNQELQTKEEEQQMLKYLNNTYYKLSNDKALNIVFTGGSVTDGYGSSDQNANSWAAHTTNWFKTNFPEAKIVGTKKSIGGTGSYLADFRFISEMAVLKPDLFFIEFAVNDKYNGESYESVVRTSETLVRKAYAVNPNIDIIYVLTFDSGDRTNDYEQLRAHRDVAEKYGLMCIKLSDEVYSMLEETGDSFDKYFKDGVHPNDEGYKYYASVITERIGNDILTDEPIETVLKEKERPTETLSKLPLMINAHLIASDKISLENSNGWEHQKANFSWLGMRYNGRVFSNTPGSKLEFEFNGTDFGLCYGIGNKMGRISCTIDDGEPIIVDAYRGNSNPKEVPIAWNLEKGNHRVVIELLAEANEKSEGNEFEIGAFLVN